MAIVLKEDFKACNKDVFTFYVFTLDNGVTDVTPILDGFDAMIMGLGLEGSHNVTQWAKPVTGVFDEIDSLHDAYVKKYRRVIPRRLEYLCRFYYYSYRFIHKDCRWHERSIHCLSEIFTSTQSDIFSTGLFSFIPELHCSGKKILRVDYQRYGSDLISQEDLNDYRNEVLSSYGVTENKQREYIL